MEARAAAGQVQEQVPVSDATCPAGGGEAHQHINTPVGHRETHTHARARKHARARTRAIEKILRGSLRHSGLVATAIGEVRSY